VPDSGQMTAEPDQEPAMLVAPDPDISPPTRQGPSEFPSVCLRREDGFGGLIEEGESCFI